MGVMCGVFQVAAEAEERSIAGYREVDGGQEGGTPVGSLDKVPE